MSVVASLASILRAAIAALALPRIAWGAALVLVIVALGRGADLIYLAAGGAVVSPSGLAAGVWTDEQMTIANTSAQRAVGSFAQGTEASKQQPVTSKLSRGELLAVLDAAYLERVEKATGSLTALDGRYRAALGAVKDLRPRGPLEALGDEIAASLRIMGLAPLDVAPGAVLIAGFRGLYAAPKALVRFAPWYALFVGLPLLALVSALGGGLTRMSAWETGRGAKLSLVDAARFVRRSCVRLALVPVLPVLGAAAALLVMAVIGALLRVPVLDLIGGFLYGVVMVLAMLLVIAGTGFVLGWPLAVASVAVGDGDALDAFVRVTSYFLRRPGRALLSLATACIAVGLGLVVAGGVAYLGLGLADTAVGFWGGATAAHSAGDPGFIVPMPGAPPLAGATARAASGFIGLWKLILFLLVAGAAVSLIADAATRAYLALREACDGQDPSALDGVPLGRRNSND